MPLIRKNQDLAKANYTHFENYPILGQSFILKLEIKTKVFKILR